MTQSPGEHHLEFTLQETALANAMLQHIGHTTVRYAMDKEGNRQYDFDTLDEAGYRQLLDNFADNEQESLALARESLVAIHEDNRLSTEEKSDRLNRYLDAYTSLTVKIDRAAFPPTRRHEVGEGIPAYIPDGFIDLGREATVDAAKRNREMIVVDKEAIFERYKPVLFDIFSADYEGMTDGEITADMFDTLAEAVYDELPYDLDMKTYGGEKVNLAALPEGVCRHQALTFQVLSQAVGLKSRMMKGDVYFDGTWIRHAVNLVQNGDNWFLYDVTNPDFEEVDGKSEWRPGVIPITRPPKYGESHLYSGRAQYSREEYAFRTADEMFWIIRPEGYVAP